MDQIEAILSVLDFMLNSKSKRHIADDILLSMSLLFVGLAFTTITIKDEKGEKNE